MSEKTTFECNQCETRIAEGEDTWGLCETCASKVDWDAMTEKGAAHWKHLFHPDSEEVQKSLTLDKQQVRKRKRRLEILAATATLTMAAALGVLLFMAWS